MANRLSVALVAMAAVGCASDELQAPPAPGTVDPAAFTLPSLPVAERAAIVHRYGSLDPGHMVPRGLLEDAIVYFDVNQAQIPNPDFLVVIDFSQFSGNERFWLIDMSTGAVEPHKVAHGDGSDPDGDGYATLFGNVPDSNMTSLGFYLTGEIYDGTHIHSMRLDGLSVDGSPNDMANTNARARLIVMHEAPYVSDANTDKQGRSNGCPALDPAIEVGVVDRIHDGALLYAAVSPLEPPIDGMGELGGGGCSSSGQGAGLTVACMLLALIRRRLLGVFASWRLGGFSSKS